MNDNNEVSKKLHDMLHLSNNQFIIGCFEVMKMNHFTNEELDVLTDVYKLNSSINSNNRYTYPILKVVSKHGRTTDLESYVNGNRRYYNEKYDYNGKTYILCNDWYHVDTALKNQKETKIPFINWIINVIKKKNLVDSNL